MKLLMYFIAFKPRGFPMHLEHVSLLQEEVTKDSLTIQLREMTASVQFAEKKLHTLLFIFATHLQNFAFPQVAKANLGGLCHSNKLQIK